MNEVGLARIVADIPRPLHKKVKAWCKNQRTTIAKMIHDSLVEHIDMLEAKQREREALSRMSKTKHMGLVPLDERPAVDLTSSPVVDRLAKVFEEHATRIGVVLNQPDELERRKHAAFTAIKKLAPLTYGNEEKVMQRLENLIAARAPELFSPQPEVPPVEGGISNPIQPTEMFTQLANLIRSTSDGEPAQDPFLGRKFNASRTRKHIEVSEDEE